MKHFFTLTILAPYFLPFSSFSIFLVRFLQYVDPFSLSFFLSLSLSLSSCQFFLSIPLFSFLFLSSSLSLSNFSCPYLCFNSFFSPFLSYLLYLSFENHFQFLFCLAKVISALIFNLVAESIDSDSFG